ncbi:glucosyl-dolichyl phosphate glucuronosyltransferase [Halapricum hydrolyticum]|uniref:Glycosyltransferase n=1 Tax=Halapricum hydrolyticum TaxID=2979991 RepID=A0AAE3ID98_9EURY|nr:glucosyl-dolichyl phosphate glucuronosyltransferase [Halapricum hydrolyticum]MCU4718448.1 glycosyltransferase [Halapricum hydrolyticum]MCU4726439.1 glycosyltransferase [Halapricum hydrolyticum]
MRVSVVLCTHTLDRYHDLLDAAESVREQTYDDVELVLVSDGSEAVTRQFERDFGDSEDVLITALDENSGLLEARNHGAEIASGDVVAFIDDDAVADPEWVAHLLESYEQQDAIAVGGKMVPEWVAGKPTFLPEEFYWLVGVTHRGFGPDGDRGAAGEVRNTFGSNISVRRDVFLDLDGFDSEIGGRQGDANLQGGETELGARLRQEYGQGVWYNPKAEVAHKVFEYRTDPKWLLDRAFWQGYSKRAMEVLVGESSDEESDFLGALLGEYVPGRVSGLLRAPSREKGMQLLMLFALTAVVGMGYLYGMTKYR